MQFKTKPIDPSDLMVMQAVREMAIECFPEGALSRAREVPGTGYWWVTKSGDSDAAFAGLKPSVRHPGVGYLALSGVLKKFRGHGLQRKLIRLRIRHAKRLGWTAVVTETIDNIHSANNLIDCGFRMYEPEFRWSKCKEAIYWRKLI